MFQGLKVDFGLNLIRSNSFSSFGKCHFKRNILPYASSSILSIALLMLLQAGTNFNLLDNNEIFELESFHLHKLTTFLLADLFKWLSERSQTIYVYVYIYIYMYVCIYIYIHYIYMYLGIYINTCIYMHCAIYIWPLS